MLDDVAGELPAPGAWEGVLFGLRIEVVKDVRFQFDEEQQFGSDPVRRAPGAPVLCVDPDLETDETVPETISADYTLRPSELAEVLALRVEARQPTMVWGPPGAAMSTIARQVAAAANCRYVDVRALLLDPSI